MLRKILVLPDKNTIKWLFKNSLDIMLVNSPQTSEMGYVVETTLFLKKKSHYHLTLESPEFFSSRKPKGVIRSLARNIAFPGHSLLNNPSLCFF